jgi:FkbM family methyltransferase
MNSKLFFIKYVKRLLAIALGFDTINPIDNKKRIEITTSCRDCDYIPKSDNAGEVFVDADNGKSYQIMHNGIRVFTDSHYGDFNIQIIKRLKGHHEPQEEKIFYEILKLIPPNSTMIELGSFWAYYSMWFYKEIKGARNYMIEPMPEFLQKGRGNFALNKIQGGDFTQACVGVISKEIVKFANGDGTYQYIPQISVDDFIREKGINFVHILHADIQGAEYYMLKGADNSIVNQKIGYIFISTHSEVIHSQCLSFLRNRGQLIIADHQPAESYSVDGLIVSCSNRKGFIKIDISKRNIVRASLVRLIARVWVSWGHRTFF